MTNNEQILELAKEIEFNAEDEAKAVYNYTQALRQVESINFDEDSKERIKAVFNEIIADELNHSKELMRLYTELTGIKSGKR